MKTSPVKAPSLRLACSPHAEKGGANSVEHHVTAGGLGKERAPVIRLAHVDGAQGDCSLKGERNVKRLPQRLAPALLVSYVYLEPFLANKERYCYRDWVMDSGAFSAHQSGTKIDLLAYIEKCKELLAQDPTLTEVFSLDVIGQWKPSLRNCERMWEAGVQAIPCYHINEPEHVLLEMAKTYPKIALGGVALAKGDVKMRFAEQCFARVWPKKIHGFGYGTEKAVMALPWHSVDATNWELGPCKFGRWNSYGIMSIRGSNQNLRAEVEWYLSLEQRARIKWRHEMALLDGEITLRLADIGSRPDAKINAFARKA